MSKAKVQSADYLFWAVKQQTGNQLRNHILIILADHRNAKTGQCDPSHSTIAKRVGCTDRSVREHIAALEKSGLIAVQRRSKEGLKTSSQYSFPLVIPDRKEIPNDRNVVPIGTEGDSVGVRKELPIKHQYLNTKLNTITPIVPFDTFYDSYPRKTGKQAAEKAWKKLSPSPALIDRIMRDIAERVEKGHWCTGPGKKYIPGPGPYLNQHRWEDEIIPAVSNQPKTDYQSIIDSFEEI